MASSLPTSRLEQLRKQAKKRTNLNKLAAQERQWQHERASRSLSRHLDRELGNMYNWKFHAGEL